MFVIAMNSTNIVQDGLNNKLVYKFPNSVYFSEKYIAVSSISMYYSWFNILSTSGNNTFTFTWTAGVTTTVYTVVIPDGLYEISAINNFIQFFCIANALYYTIGGLNYYPFEILVNPNRYAAQLNTYFIPNTLPVGATIPVGFPGFPTTSINSTVTFPARFNELIGYPVNFASASNIGGSAVFGTPTASSNYASKNAANTISYLSNVAPNIQPNSSIFLVMSNISNPYTQPSGVIYSLNSNVGIGELIDEKPPNFMWTKMIEGTYNELRLSFLSSTLQQILINDPNMTILLTIRDKNEYSLS